MRCYFCDALLEQIGDVATSSKESEIAIAYVCPRCGKRYQAQWIPTAIFAYTPGQEGTLLRLTECSRCQQLYRHESRHFCQVT